MNREKINRKGFRGYFTVEAALVMPIVFVCYFFIMMLLCYIYERCIWEQNAYRLPVWKEYVDGHLNMYTETEVELSEKDVCRYILECLNEEEASGYLFGQDITAEINVRGGFLKVTRNILYPQFGERAYELALSGVCLEPVEYIRTVNLLKKQLFKDEGENDDKE